MGRGGAQAGNKSVMQGQGVHVEWVWVDVCWCGGKGGWCGGKGGYMHRGVSVALCGNISGILSIANQQADAWMPANQGRVLPQDIASLVTRPLSGKGNTGTAVELTTVALAPNNPHVRSG